MKWIDVRKKGGAASQQEDAADDDTLKSVPDNNRIPMQIIDFVEACDTKSKTDAEVFELLCYYKAKEDGMEQFSLRKLSRVYLDAGLTMPDGGALDKNIKSGSSFRPHGIEGTLRFSAGTFDRLNKKYGHLWITAVGVPSGSEVIDEKRFCGKREGFDRLVAQINSSYGNGSYDACASVMRRLLEASLILSFQSKGIEDTIRGNDGYIRLDDIVRKAVDTDALGLSGKADDLIAISKIGDYSGHGPTYTLSANDINSVRIAYREVLDILYGISGLT